MEANSFSAQNSAESVPQEPCWFCKRNPADEKSKLLVHMYGELDSKYGRHSFFVPMHDKDGRRIGSMTLSAPIEDVITPKYTWRHTTIDVPRCKVCVSIWRRYAEKEEYPPIRELLGKKWRFGLKPSEDEIKRVLRIKTVPKTVKILLLGLFIVFCLVVIICSFFS